ncbi:DUF3173 domain-containing protein [Furfurilactobacillus milii]|uniref:DUF3173 domain-containing protein n=1 Tax=Furfurilactobacillus milii TaxID=2888272 RepID=A0A6N9I0X8_9LACO|nr:DUF3173 domain-containing protein [Furfurilactobacillus milii]MYV16033.1 DUF3173 domain-containing protein [Furfurilactobacillus milii]
MNAPILPITLTKRELISLGYGPGFSADIIRQAKALMVEKGYGYYRTRKLGRVPVSAVEEILGIPVQEGLAGNTPIPTR